MRLFEHRLRTLRSAGNNTLICVSMCNCHMLDANQWNASLKVKSHRLVFTVPSQSLMLFQPSIQVPSCTRPQTTSRQEVFSYVYLSTNIETWHSFITSTTTNKLHIKHYHQQPHTTGKHGKSLTSIDYRSPGTNYHRTSSRTRSMLVRCSTTYT